MPENTVDAGVINPETTGRNVNLAAELFSNHGEFLLSIFRKNLPEQDAYDLWQDLFLKLATKPLPSPIPNLRGYLYRIAINDIADFRRRSQVRQEKIGEYSTMLKPENADANPVRQLMEVESLAAIFRHIEQNLPANISQVVIQKHKNNMTYRQIAEKMKLKPKTVNQYLSLGMKKIRQIQDEIKGD